MEIDFELVLEGISLGLDVVILGFLYKSYESCSAYIQALKVTRIMYVTIAYCLVPRNRQRNEHKIFMP